MPTDYADVSGAEVGFVSRDNGNDEASKPSLVPASWWGTHGAALAQNAWRGIPIMPGGKVPGRYVDGRYSNLAGWTKDGVPTEAKVRERAAWPTQPGDGLHAGVGIVLGQQGDDAESFVVAIDIDVRDAKLADRIEELCIEKLGSAPVRFGARPKRLMLYRCSEPIGKMTSARFRLPGDASGSANHVVEVLAAGQQFVAYGRHPCGVDYAWKDGIGPDAVAPAELPLVTPEDLRAFLGACEDLMREASGVEAGAAHEAPAPTDGGYTGEGNPAHRAGLLALLKKIGDVIRHRGQTTDIFCPFADDHPDRADTGTALLSGGGFFCNHATCLGRTPSAFIDRLKKIACEKGLDADGIYQKAWRAARREIACEVIDASDRAIVKELRGILDVGLPLVSRDVRQLLFLPTQTRRDFLSEVERAHGASESAALRAMIRREQAQARRAHRDEREGRLGAIVPMPIGALAPVPVEDASAAVGAQLAAFFPAPLAGSPTC